MMDHQCESGERLKALTVYLSIVEVSMSINQFLLDVTEI